MHWILNSPMQADGVLDLLGVAGQAGDVVARFKGDVRALAPFELDLRYRAQRLPLSSLAQVAHIARVRSGPAVPDFHPAVAFGGGAHVVVLQLGKVNAVRPPEQPREVFGKPFWLPFSAKT
jgi:hypothetical protein